MVVRNHVVLENERGVRTMAGNTLTRSDLSEAVYREIGLSRNESAEMVETVLTRISNSLVKGENVKISSFGTFAVRDKAARMGRNPKTGEEVPIDPRRVLVSRPSHMTKDRANGGAKKQWQFLLSRLVEARENHPTHSGPSAKLPAILVCRSTFCDSGKRVSPR